MLSQSSDSGVTTTMSMQAQRSSSRMPLTSSGHDRRKRKKELVGPSLSAYMRKAGFERSCSINKLIQRRIILKDDTRNAYHLSMDRLALNNRVASKCSAGDYSNEHTPLLLSDDCTHSQLSMLIHSSKYIVRKLTVDGKEFDMLGPNEEFDEI